VAEGGEADVAVPRGAKPRTGGCNYLAFFEYLRENFPTVLARKIGPYIRRIVPAYGFNTQALKRLAYQTRVTEVKIGKAPDFFQALVV